MPLEWLIVGGGIHGVHLAARLLGEVGVSPDHLAIVDPGEKLLARWHACAAVTGMGYLRSPVVHHLDVDPWSLEEYADQPSTRELAPFAPPYSRPSLELFNEHCDKVVETFGLASCHIQDRAVRCLVDCDVAAVKLASGRTVQARQLVLAIGGGEEPKWPRWAPQGDPRVRHVFEPSFDGWPSSGETVAVVGGGISAGQVALRLVAEGHRVHLVSRHPLRQHQFDSDPGWLGPKKMADFSRVRNYDRRRTLITEARHRGSVPPDVRRSLSRAIHQGQLQWHEAGVVVLEERSGASLAMKLTSNEEVSAERILLATGFSAARPGGSMIDELIASASLPCARCGYPIVDSGLRWHPRVYVTGPLAELELGPVSRNIAGARRAGKRLVDALLAS